MGSRTPGCHRRVSLFRTLGAKSAVRFAYFVGFVHLTADVHDLSPKCYMDGTSCAIIYDDSLRISADSIK